MKTLAELNSKWYWRLVKVIGFLFYALIFITSSVGIYFYFSHYNPTKLENAKHTIDKNSTFTSALEHIKQELPGENLRLKDLKKIIKEEYLNDSRAIAINFVMLEYLGKKIDTIGICEKTYIYPLSCYETNSDTIFKAINNESDRSFLYLSYETYHDAQNTFNETYTVEKKANETILNLINGKSMWELNSFYDFKNKYGINIYDIVGKSDEYRSILDYIKIIFSILGVLGGILLINLSILKTIFYIVLGKFNPEK